MNIILIGPPGAGKGTQAGVLSNKYNLIHVSTGEILRTAVKNKTESGVLAKSYMDSGELVPDEVVTKIVSDEMSGKGTGSGFILDGFPRTLNQAEELDKELKALGIKLDFVLYFNTKESVSIERLSGRRVCPGCGLNYHIKNMPPKKEGFCDKCSAKLIQRDDDKPETIKRRLDIYKNDTEPLLAYYSKKGLMKEVDGNLEVNALFEKLKVLFVNASDKVSKRD